MSELEVGLIARGDWVVDEVVRAVGGMFEPIALLLDQYDAMLNPRLAPDEMVRWLSRCLGIPVGSDATRGERRLLAAVPRLYRSWATSNGVRLLVSSYLDVAEDDVEIVESGAADWSAVGGSELPGSDDPFVEVRIARPLEEDELETLSSLLTSALPVGMPCRILSG